MSAGLDALIDGTEYVTIVAGTTCFYDSNITCNTNCSNCPAVK